MKKTAVKILVTLAVFFLFVLIRRFEHILFPDAFLSYFARDRYLHEPLPPLHSADLGLILLRYILLSLLSLLLFRIWFPRPGILKSLLYFYLFAGIILILLFLLFHHFYPHLGYRPLFYTRRLLTQPIFLFVLLPILWFAMQYKE